jgi:predicted dehydrogenase
MPRVHPRWHKVRDLLRERRIGELRTFVGTFGYKLAQPDNVRYDPGMGGGVLLDVGFYPITMSRFCFEAEPATVQAHAHGSVAHGVDRLTSAILDFPQGHAVFSVGMETFPVQRAQLIGTAGHMEMVNPWNPARDRASEIVLTSSPDIDQPAPPPITLPAVDQYTCLAEAFARAAQAGGPGPVPLEDSIRTMAVLDALRRSLSSGRAETVESWP